MRAGWDGAEPPALPPLTPRERVRLVLRGGWALAALAVLFGIFLLFRGLTSLPRGWRGGG